MTPEWVRAVFEYEPDGMLRRRVVEGNQKERPWRKIGKSYLGMTVGKRGLLYLHRAVFAWHAGYFPDFVDHINNDKTDNRIENLRAADAAANQYNSKRKAHNRSGYKGVVFHPPCTGKPWHAKIVFKGKTISLGYYADVLDAASAYNFGAELYAGDFARVN